MNPQTLIKLAGINKVFLTDEIETHAQGGTYIRDREEGNGTILPTPFERWRYRYLEALGNNVILEFVDVDRTATYQLTTDPSEKDRILPSPRP